MAPRNKLNNLFLGDGFQTMSPKKGGKRRPKGQKKQKNNSNALKYALAELESEVNYGGMSGTHKPSVIMHTLPPSGGSRTTMKAPSILGGRSPSSTRSTPTYALFGGNSDEGFSPEGNCLKYTDSICLNADDYPGESILSVLSRNRRVGSDLVADVIDQSADSLIDGVTSAQENSYTFNHYYGSMSSSNRRQDDVGHRDFAEEGGFLCPSEIMYAKPKRGKTAQGEWKDIVNVKDYTQTLRMEKCL